MILLSAKAAFLLLLQSPVHYKWGQRGGQETSVSIQTAPDKVCPHGWYLKCPGATAEKTVQLPCKELWPEERFQKSNTGRMLSTIYTGGKLEAPVLGEF